VTENNPNLERFEFVCTESKIVSTPSDPRPWIAPLPKCQVLVLACASKRVTEDEWLLTLAQCPKLNAIAWGVYDDRITLTDLVTLSDGFLDRQRAACPQLNSVHGFAFEHPGTILYINPWSGGNLIPQVTTATATATA
jgi:hypothetical protein